MGYKVSTQVKHLIAYVHNRSSTNCWSLKYKEFRNCRTIRVILKCIKVLSLRATHGKIAGLILSHLVGVFSEQKMQSLQFKIQDPVSHDWDLDPVDTVTPRRTVKLGLVQVHFLDNHFPAETSEMIKLPSQAN